jgi:hypothetical protein
MQPSAVGDVLAVCENGDVIGLSGETLTSQWVAQSRSAVQDISPVAIEDFGIDYATSSTVAELRDGLFKNRPEVFTALPKSVNADPPLLVLVTRSVSQGQAKRHLLVLAVASGSSPTSADLQKLTPLDVVPISCLQAALSEPVQCQIDVQSGLLLLLHQGSLSVCDLSSAIPKLKSIIQMDNAESFARLTRPFVLACSSDSIGLYNYQYRSVHAQSTLDLSDLPPESQNPQSFHLISYMRSQNVVVALMDNVLVSIQVEPPKSQGKRRNMGLLIDSISRGTVVEVPAKRHKSNSTPKEFSRQLPGTMTETYLAQYHTDIEAADDLLANNDLAMWEEMLRPKFQVQLQTQADGVDSQQATEWEWHLDPTTYPTVDRRWVLYAISRVFSVGPSESDDMRLQLRLVLPDSSVTTYLAVAGHLSLSNLKSAFREDVEGDAESDQDLASDLIQSLAEDDPSMTLLLNYLRATKLGEVELLLAIRALMLSMDLIPTTANSEARRLLRNEPHSENDKDQLELDDLEREIAITEHYLGDESSSRSRGITLAFTKLWRLPARGTVKALRKALRAEEILALIQLLRVELIQGAWTSLYIDPTSFDAEGNEPPPDGVIALIAELLGRCLDAIGSGGWLLNDAIAGADGESGDFVTALTMEVAAALEGVQESITLNGLVSESVRFGLAAEKSIVARQAWNSNKSIALQLEGRESRLLPLGLKTKQMPTKEKVVSGGEVVQRSLREAGHLISQKVEAYSLERLVI